MSEILDMLDELGVDYYPLSPERREAMEELLKRYREIQDEIIRLTEIMRVPRIMVPMDGVKGSDDGE